MHNARISDPYIDNDIARINMTAGLALIAFGVVLLGEIGWVLFV